MVQETRRFSPGPKDFLLAQETNRFSLGGGLYTSSLESTYSRLQRAGMGGSDQETRRFSAGPRDFLLAQETKKFSPGPSDFLLERVGALTRRFSPVPRDFLLVQKIFSWRQDKSRHTYIYTEWTI